MQELVYRRITHAIPFGHANNNPKRSICTSKNLIAMVPALAYINSSNGTF